MCSGLSAYWHLLTGIAYCSLAALSLAVTGAPDVDFLSGNQGNRHFVAKVIKVVYLPIRPDDSRTLL